MAKIERFHQTLEKRLRRQPRAASLAEPQAHLDALRVHYNTVRPHRALGRHTSAEVNTAQPKAATGIPLADGHFRVRHDKFDSNGKLTLRHNSWLHRIRLGRRTPA